MEKPIKSPNFSSKTETKKLFNITAEEIRRELSRIGKELEKKDTKIGAKRKFPDVDDVNDRKNRSGSQPDSNKGLSSAGFVSPKNPMNVGLKSNPQQCEEKKKSDVTDDNGSASANAKMMELQDQKVRVLICIGGGWELVNGVLEYMPFELMRRMLTLPLNPTYSELMNRVAKKLNLNPRSGFQLSYKIPLPSSFHSNNEVIEIGDDEEVSALIDVAVKMPHGMVTLCVVESEGCDEDYSSSGSNQADNVAPLLVTKNVNRPELNYKRKEENHRVEVEKGAGYPRNAEKSVFRAMPPPPPPPRPEIRFPTVYYEPSTHLWVGDMYINKEVLIQALEKKCLKQGFKFQTIKLTYERFEARCLKLFCKWFFRATIVRASEYKGKEVFKIRIYDDCHTCLKANESQPLSSKQKDGKKEDNGTGMSKKEDNRAGMSKKDDNRADMSKKDDNGAGMSKEDDNGVGMSKKDDNGVGISKKGDNGVDMSKKEDNGLNMLKKEDNRLSMSKKEDNGVVMSKRGQWGGHVKERGQRGGHVKERGQRGGHVKERGRGGYVKGLR